MFRVLLAGVALAAIASGAQAAPTTKKPRPPTSVEILNQRTLKLESFSIAAANKPDKLLAKLAKPIPGGAKAKLKIGGAKGCAFVATWKFEDAGDQAEVDLCNDPKIVLTD
ncbi:MAG: hypothetical protein KDJ25_12775 [Rhodoblastus sp.]|nr:hypothetical protein [Rhodoblastus sp.]MCB1544209.1 hypothetical protein [Rhodoblastus sp.]